MSSPLGARRSLWRIAILLVLLTLPSFAAGDDDPRKPEPTASPAIKGERGPASDWIQATGTLEPEEVVDVSPHVNGVVQRFGVAPHDRSKPVDFGTAVDEGTVLLYLDPTLYRLQVERAQAALNRARAEIAPKAALLDQLQRVQQDLQKRSAQGSVPSSEVDAVGGKLELARAEKKVAEAEVAVAQVDLKAAEANLAFCEVKSPIKGILIDRRINLGQMASSSVNAPSLFLIARDLRHLQVWASVYERDAPACRPGQKATFTVEAFPAKIFKGVVEQLRLNAAINQNRVTYTVIIKVDNPDLVLKPYLTAYVHIRTGERKDAGLTPDTSGAAGDR